MFHLVSLYVHQSRPVYVHLNNCRYLIHELACVEAEAVEEHLFAEDMHFLNSDEQGNRCGANDGAGPSTNQQVSRLVVIYFIS